MYSLNMIFVFKQKTAYEMRISDWSSDVCSSDLRADLPEGQVDRNHDRRRRHGPDAEIVQVDHVEQRVGQTGEKAMRVAPEGFGLHPAGVNDGRGKGKLRHLPPARFLAAKTEYLAGEHRDRKSVV